MSRWDLTFEVLQSLESDKTSNYIEFTDPVSSTNRLYTTYSLTYLLGDSY